MSILHGAATGLLAYLPGHWIITNVDPFLGIAWIGTVIVLGYLHFKRLLKPMTDKEPSAYMMTVGDLVKQLSELDQNAYVVLQRDSEGNGYSPLAGAEAAKYRPENTWSGEVPHPDDIKNGEYDPEDVAKMLDCVVIFPIN